MARIEMNIPLCMKKVAKGFHAVSPLKIIYRTMRRPTKSGRGMARVNCAESNLVVDRRSKNMFVPIKEYFPTVATNVTENIPVNLTFSDTREYTPGRSHSHVAIVTSVLHLKAVL